MRWQDGTIRFGFVRLNLLCARAFICTKFVCVHFVHKPTDMIPASKPAAHTLTITTQYLPISPLLSYLYIVRYGIPKIIYAPILCASNGIVSKENPKRVLHTSRYRVAFTDCSVGWVVFFWKFLERLVQIAPDCKILRNEKNIIYNGVFFFEGRQATRWRKIAQTALS